MEDKASILRGSERTENATREKETVERPLETSVVQFRYVGFGMRVASQCKVFLVSECLQQAVHHVIVFVVSCDFGRAMFGGKRDCWDIVNRVSSLPMNHGCADV